MALLAPFGGAHVRAVLAQIFLQGLLNRLRDHLFHAALIAGMMLYWPRKGWVRVTSSTDNLVLGSGMRQ